MKRGLEKGLQVYSNSISVYLRQIKIKLLTSFHKQIRSILYSMLEMKRKTIVYFVINLFFIFGCAEWKFWIGSLLIWVN